MNRTSLMLRDAAYIAALLHRLSTAGNEQRQKAERIILRIMHRNNMLFTNTVLILFTELEQAGISVTEPRAVDLMQARLYNLIWQSCSIADENNNLIKPEKEKSK